MVVADGWKYSAHAIDDSSVLAVRARGRALSESCMMTTPVDSQAFATEGAEWSNSFGDPSDTNSTPRTQSDEGSHCPN